jgi:hypothetical protein
MDKDLDDFIKIEVKLYKKLNKKIIGLTYLKNFFEIDEKLFQKFYTFYEKLIKENIDSFIIVDARNIGSVPLSKIPLEKLKRLRELDNIVEKNIISICYIVKGIIIKNTINCIIKLFPSVIPIKVCSETTECFEFLETVIKNKNN